MFSRAALSRAVRHYATESEYMFRLKGADQKQLQDWLSKGTPFLGVFTVEDHPSLQAHNDFVDAAVKRVNSGAVRMQVLHGDLKDPVAQSMAQALRLEGAPTLCAFAKGQMLDTLQGLQKDQASVDQFIKKFLGFVGDNRSIDGEEEAPVEEETSAEEEGGAKGELARLAMDIKQGKVHSQTSEALQAMESIVEMAEKEVALEKAIRKKEGPAKKRADEMQAMATATPGQITLVNALLLQADTLQETGQSERVRKILDRIKQDFSQFSIPNATKTTNAIEMALVTEHLPLPSEEYARRVAANPHDFALQLRLAVSMFKDGRQKEGVALGLQVMRKDKKLNDGAPQKMLKCMFNVLGPQDPITTEGQKKMMAYLF